MEIELSSSGIDEWYGWPKSAPKIRKILEKFFKTNAEVEGEVREASHKSIFHLFDPKAKSGF